MREMYIILSKIGWVWLAVFAVGLAVGLILQRQRRQRMAGGRGFPVVSTRNDEQKQS